jgi:hypothetical protein
MNDLDIPDTARWFMNDERMTRQDCLTIAARIIVAAELRRMAYDVYCWTDQHKLIARANELDPPRTDK